MYRHRRHTSLDSYSPLSVGIGPRSSYTLQKSATGNGPRTSRLTAHTSPLALSAVVSAPLSPQTEEFETDTDGVAAVGTEPVNGLPTEEDMMRQMDQEMEAMVSSVVNTPTTPSYRRPVTHPAQLGLGLPPGKLHRSASVECMRDPEGGPALLPSQESRQLRQSLLSGSFGAPPVPAHAPKTAMTMRAALGSYRKRRMSGEIPEANTLMPPALVIQAATPPEAALPSFIPPTEGADVRPTSPLSKDDTSQPALTQLRPPLLRNRAHTVPSHRRSVSTGTIPSLQQIQDWSQKRKSPAESTVSLPGSPVKEVVANMTERDLRLSPDSATRPAIEDDSAGRNSPDASSNDSVGSKDAANADVNAATSGSALVQLLARRTKKAREESSASDSLTMPSLDRPPATATLAPTRPPQRSALLSQPTSGRRADCAKQMVHLLEKRRTASLGIPTLTSPVAGITV